MVGKIIFLQGPSPCLQPPVSAPALGAKKEKGVVEL